MHLFWKSHLEVFLMGVKPLAGNADRSNALIRRNRHRERCGGPTLKPKSQGRLFPV